MVAVSLKKSKKYLGRAKKLIPALTQTFSKAHYSYVDGVYPTYLSHGNGSHVFDVDNNEYIDFVLGLGPITLGYNYPSVNKACLLYTSPSPRDELLSRMPSSA